MKKVKFQFDDSQEHQIKAIKSTLSLFRGVSENDAMSISNKLHRSSSQSVGLDYDVYMNEDIKGTMFGESRLLENLNEVQLENKLFLDNNISIYSPTFTIEMETGTGKTYVYLRTICELFKEYGFKKFVIVVPSIPIRMGVMKSIEMLNDDFKVFNLELKEQTIVYDSKKINSVRQSFLEAEDLRILVINKDAFNKANNVFNNPNEYGYNMYDDMKDIKPIIILDEPQKMEGTKAQASKTKEAIDGLKPLFILKYSATHKNIENLIYKLDSYESSEQNLVKKIKVNTIYNELPKDTDYVKYVSFTRDLKAKVEIFSSEQGDKIKVKTFDVTSQSSLFELSGGLEQYKNINIGSNPNKEKPLHLIVNSESVFLEEGEAYSSISEINTIRYQIKIAIKKHFEKQFEILDLFKRDEIKQPLKALTLFFIDKVKHVRDFDEPDQRGLYLKIFDEEYEKYINTNLFKAKYEKYSDLLNGVYETSKVREGYFSVDKNNNVINDEDYKGTEADKEADENRDRAIDLILNKKDELISFDEKLSFIFSHSALREGWDNPNVFTICTLKNGSSEIAKKQELGRGLRLPVDVTGNRCRHDKVNELTVIANDTYENFAKNLQESYAEDNNFNAESVTKNELFKMFELTEIEKGDFSKKLTVFYNELVNLKVINKSGVITQDFDVSKLKFKDDILVEHQEELREAFKEVMSDKGSKRVKVINGDVEQVTNERFSFVEETEFIGFYKSLFNRLKYKTVYKSNIDNQKYIDDCIKTINDKMELFKKRRSLKLTTSEVIHKQAGNVELKAKANDSQKGDDDFGFEYKSNMQLANTIMYHTNLPRLAILKIILGIKDRVALNITEVLELVIQQLKAKLVEHSSESFLEQNFEAINSYKVINESEFTESSIFALDEVDNDILENRVNHFKASKNNKSMHKYYLLDGEGEVKFAEWLEEKDEVIMFTKLRKGGFTISTPYGKYTPDWAVVYRTEGEEYPEMYFIAESKFKKTWEQLQREEKVKINCSIVHFNTVKNEIKEFNTVANWFSSIDSFKDKFNVE